MSPPKKKLFSPSLFTKSANHCSQVQGCLSLDSYSQPFQPAMPKSLGIEDVIIIGDELLENDDGEDSDDTRDDTGQETWWKKKYIYRCIRPHGYFFKIRVL